MKKMGLYLITILFFIHSIMLTNAFTLNGNGYTIKGSIGYGVASNSILIEQPVGRVFDGYEICLGPFCRMQPIIGPIKTFLNDILKTIFHGGETVSIKVNVSDLNGRINIQKVVINITDPNNITRVENGLMENISFIDKGYTYSFDRYIKASDVGGLWNVKIIAINKYKLRSIRFGNFTVKIIPMKLWLEFKRNDVSETVYIPGIGDIPASQLRTIEYENPEHYFLLSYKNGTVYGLVFFYEEPLIISTKNGTANYSLILVENLTNSNTFLVFTRGDWKEIENKMKMVESKTFLLKPSPSFGFGIGAYYPAEIMLIYSHINIQGKDIIQKGYHRLAITSNTSERMAVMIKRE